MESLLNISSLSVQYGKGEDKVHAVQSVDFIAHGEIFGLVGESGSGKSTIGKSIVGLVDTEKGSVITYKGSLMPNSTQSRCKKREVCGNSDGFSGSIWLFQITHEKVGEALLDVMHVHGLKRNREERLDYARELLKPLDCPKYAHEISHEFSGSQRQRICIARALVLEPLIIADEPVSALDVSVQASALVNETITLKNRGIAFLFISHDLAVVH